MASNLVHYSSVDQLIACTSGLFSFSSISIFDFSSSYRLPTKTDFPTLDISMDTVDFLNYSPGVLEITKSFLFGKQVFNDLVNSNKMPTNLEGTSS